MPSPEILRPLRRANQNLCGTFPDNRGLLPATGRFPFSCPMQTKALPTSRYAAMISNDIMDGCSVAIGPTCLMTMQPDSHNSLHKMAIEETTCEPN